MQTHPAVKGLLSRSFPFYDELSYVFKKDRATGERVESFVNIESNFSLGFENFAHVDLNDM